MRTTSLPAILAIMSALVIGCGHTNRLSEYPINGKKALFRHYVDPSAPTSWVIVESPTSNTIVDIIAGIGSAIASDQARRKLDAAVNGDSVASFLAQGITLATTEYLGIRPVASLADDPDLIIETELDEYKFISASTGLGVHTRGRSRITDRRSGVIVWEDSEGRYVSLTHTFLAPLGGRVISSGASIFNAVQFFAMSEEEIRSVIGNACVATGREIGDVLREDVSDAVTGK